MAHLRQVVFGVIVVSVRVVTVVEATILLYKLSCKILLYKLEKMQQMAHRINIFKMKGARRMTGVSR